MASSHFSSLMAQSRQQTEAVQAQAKAQLEAKQRREAEKAREQAEREKKAKEAEERMRQRHFEEQKREKERQEKRAQEKEAEARREAQRERVREAVLLGKGGGKSRARSGGGGGGGWGRAKKKTDEEDDGSVGGGGGALTREEKRARRMENEFRMPGSASRSKLPTPKAGKRLPGGALPSNLVGSASRGSRTIDDAMRDRDRGKTVSGNSARSYDGSFSDSKIGKSSSDKFAGKGLPKKTPVGRDPPSSAPKRAPLPLARPGSAPASTKAVPKKRSRSISEDSDYDSSPPPRKRSTNGGGGGGGGGNDVRDMIWGIFGKSRDKYVNRNDLSDDEDMEAGAFDVEREEKRSAKLARQEDLEAELEEKRREEEKRRRRMSKA
ncbi:unnamed protein product [Peniophora sp. CBMAI 1063]|nr:unnamed protein product [Peniophora sp. CBMAI 1063]